MAECDALCTRLSIMVNGKLMCLGSGQTLKNKYATILICFLFIIIDVLRYNQQRFPYKHLSKLNSTEKHSLYFFFRFGGGYTLRIRSKPDDTVMQHVMELIQNSFSDVLLKVQSCRGWV